MCVLAFLRGRVYTYRTCFKPINFLPLRGEAVAAPNSPSRTYRSPESRNCTPARISTHCDEGRRFTAKSWQQNYGLEGEGWEAAHLYQIGRETWSVPQDLFLSCYLLSPLPIIFTLIT
jgi:hypothetical protein